METFEKYLKEILFKIGYTLKRKIFLCDLGDRIILCEVQKSRNSNGLYLNFGVVFKKYDTSKSAFAKSYDWHFVGRHNRIAGNIHSLISTQEFTSNEYLKLLFEQIQHVIHPFLITVSSNEFLKLNYPEHFPFDKIRVQNLTDSEITSLFEDSV